MKYITLPVPAGTSSDVSLSGERHVVRRLSFYLAMEEFVARHLPAGDYFFLWQVEPSVIFGRHQVADNEVNMDYCRENGIRIYRRKSGGGCVYADMGNLMWSFVCADENVAFAFNRFVGMMLLVLNKLGVKAACTTHNDVLIGNRKVSGTASYHLPGRSIVHGTMLYDANMEHIVKAITPSRQKLEAKGIQSVRQRITLLKYYTSLTMDELKAMIRETLCQEELALTPSEVEVIEQIEKTYLRN